VILLLESFLANILVVLLRIEIRWIQIKKADRAIILPNQLFKILILDDHLCKPSMGLLDDREVASYIMGLATEAGEPGIDYITLTMTSYCHSFKIYKFLFLKLKGSVYRSFRLT